MIVQPSVLSLSSFEKLRKKIFSTGVITSMLDMGRGIFGIDFGSTAFVIGKGYPTVLEGNYFRLHKRIFQYINPDDIERLYLLSKEEKIIRYTFDEYDTETGIKEDNYNSEGQKIYYTAKQSDFMKIPGTPIAYWLSGKIFSAFEESISLGELAVSRNGMKTGDMDLLLLN